jgi:hypothetical protein
VRDALRRVPHRPILRIRSLDWRSKTARLFERSLYFSLSNHRAKEENRIFATLPMRMSSTHLRRLPVRGGTSFVDIQVHQGTMADARLWHAMVQPHVRHAGRLDAGWDWPVLYKRSRIFERTFRRKASLQCIDMANSEGRNVPLAIMLLSEGYPALDHDGRRSVYLWYLAAAPAGALQAMGFTHPRPAFVLHAIIDAAIQRSYQLGYDGRVGLHALPAGKDELCRKYRDDVRMMSPGDQVRLSLPRRLRGGKDGRYFCVDPVRARSLTASLDHLR